MQTYACISVSLHSYAVMFIYTVSVRLKYASIQVKVGREVTLTCALIALNFFSSSGQDLRCQLMTLLALSITRLPLMLASNFAEKVPKASFSDAQISWTYKRSQGHKGCKVSRSWSRG